MVCANQELHNSLVDSLYLTLNLAENHLESQLMFWVNAEWFNFLSVLFRKFRVSIKKKINFNLACWGEVMWTLRTDEKLSFKKKNSGIWESSMMVNMVGEKTVKAYLTLCLWQVMSAKDVSYSLSYQFYHRGEHESKYMTINNSL